MVRLVLQTINSLTWWPPAPVSLKPGVPQERGGPFPGDGGVRTSVSFFSECVVWEENRDLSKTTPPLGVLVCDHAGLVINKFSVAHSDTLTPMVFPRPRRDLAPFCGSSPFPRSGRPFPVHDALFVASGVCSFLWKWCGVHEEGGGGRGLER